MTDDEKLVALQVCEDDAWGGVIDAANDLNDGRNFLSIDSKVGEELEFIECCQRIRANLKRVAIEYETPRTPDGEWLRDQ